MEEGKQRKFGLVPKVVPEATTKTLLRIVARVWQAQKSRII